MGPCTQIARGANYINGAFLSFTTITTAQKSFLGVRAPQQADGRQVVLSLEAGHAVEGGSRTPFASMRPPAY